MDKDEDLYDRIRQGDLNAFDRLYERYQNHLFRLIFSYLKNREESEEVFHEAFIQVLTSPNEVEFERGTFKGWIYQVARNLCLNRIRSKKRGDHAFLHIERDHTAQSSETQLLDKDLTEKAIAAAEKLPQPMLELFNMRRMGMAYQDISLALDVPIGTVKSRVHALIEALKVGLKL
jgi:RNA polymerase sigma-70 factor (ECF subfamily)